jgi:membrane protease YdiL (CAAX protease family)
VQPPPLASRPALWPVLAAYLAAFVLVLVASVICVLVAAIPRAGLNPDRLAQEAARFALSAPGLLGAALVSAVVLTLVALITARLLGGGVAARLRTGPTRARPLGIAAAIVGMAGLSLACASAADLAGQGKGGVMEAIALALRTSNPVRIILAVLAIAVAPGFAEETFFRGLMQTRLRERWRRWPAIVVTAVAFGVFHLDPVQGALAIIAGIFFGWVADRFGGIRPTIAAHAANNTMFVLFASFASPDQHPSRVENVLVLLAGAAACAGATVVIRSRHAVRNG